MFMHAGILFIGAIFSVMVVGGIALVAVLATRSNPPSTTVHPAVGETPLQIIDRRFALGEIDAEEYKRARDLLGPA